MGDDVTIALRFCGRELEADELALIQELTRRYSALSRAEIAHTVCELLGWHRANARLKARECRDLLEHLELAGLVELPAKRSTKPRGTRTRVPHTNNGEPGEMLRGELAAFTPLTLTRVQSKEQHELWRELIGRYHPQGHAVAYGAQLRYLIELARPQVQVVGCLQFSSPAWRIAVRDTWIGWDDNQRARALQHIVNNSRFLLLPWIEVRHLASATLARAARAVVRDWPVVYGIRPWLLETLVDPSRYAGTSYRAANWLELGRTTGRGRMDRGHQRTGHAPKTVWLYPLDRHARQRLCTPPAAAAVQAHG